MASPLVKYLRWGALTSGVLYGYMHYNTLLKQAEQNKEYQEYRRLENLIAKAKHEYAQLKGAQSNSSVVTDPNSPQFDFEAYLKSVEAESA
ncbi:F1F0 ATP synthase subunit e, mitochondrial [Dimargaris verticillata]|uniref:ATP synthase F(0) complex subunit e, mitochondrial n=1 Tax=Dimargaris verticillata TaxID=2761393 RepID=A0A9W8B7P2_9FUNG|nr:F1F0 ATP synthase subunit e, mitochondrial [Dimargaris verticillata]